ncbi:MAG: hypothetical protein H0U97_12285 [Gammaproteobacteria bacterium]|nr:hypothetical protein [Gammaproteobacteria bacterium]
MRLIDQHRLGLRQVAVGRGPGLLRELAPPSIRSNGFGLYAHVSRAAFNSGDRKSSAMRFFASASSFALTTMVLLSFSGTLIGFWAGLCRVMVTAFFAMLNSSCKGGSKPQPIAERRPPSPHIAGAAGKHESRLRIMARGVLWTRPTVCLSLGMNTKPSMSLSTIEEAAAREAKHDALRVSVVGEAVWAVLLVACLLTLLWSMLGRG